VPPHQHLRLWKSSMIKAFWSGSPTSPHRSAHNWGDVLTPIIIHAFSGDLAVNRRKKAHARTFCVGSILHRLRAEDIVWGSGMQSPSKVVNPLPRGVVFKAVRGPMTREVLLGMGAEVPEVYGDPALLIPYILDVPEQPTTHELGIIPHYMDTEAVEHLAGPGVKIIDICGGVKEVVREVLSCERILSSSLHGVILGDAYHKPTGWLVVSEAERIFGGRWKFEDYLASTQRAATPTLMDDGGSIPEIQWLGEPSIDLQPLIQACPFNRRGVQRAEDLLLHRQ